MPHRCFLLSPRGCSSLSTTPLGRGFSTYSTGNGVGVAYLGERHEEDAALVLVDEYCAGKADGSRCMCMGLPSLSVHRLSWHGV